MAASERISSKLGGIMEGESNEHNRDRQTALIEEQTDTQMHIGMCIGQVAK